MAYENNDKKQESIYSKRIRAGKRRTYFFDVRATRGNDYYLTITESRKRFDDNGYDRHKVFLYKEDFNKFVKALNEAVEYVKTDLMPDFDFDAFNHEDAYDEHEGTHVETEQAYASTTSPVVDSVVEQPEPLHVSEATETIETTETPSASHNEEVVDKW